MRQIIQSHLIKGTLIDQQNVTHEVEFVISTKHNTGQKKMKEGTISKINFAHKSPVPDGGPYILQYAFNGRQRKDRVKVKMGKLIGAITLLFGSSTIK